MSIYQFDKKQSFDMESSPIPFAVYQFVDRRVRTLLLSDGLLRLFEFDRREDAVHMMDTDRYRLVHPDDVTRLAESTFFFAGENVKYDVIYRTRTAKSEDYIIVRVRGEHVTTPTGELVAYVWYENEGKYVKSERFDEDSVRQSYGYMLDMVSSNQRVHYDFLTGLPNMTYFFELADAGIKRMRSEGLRPAILFIDISGMKAYNGKFGFAEGDKLIKETGLLLKQHFSNDNCGRFGQDHFAVFTDSAGLESKLQEVFEACRLLNGGRSLPLRVGIFSVPTDGQIEIGAACDWAKMACNTGGSAQVSHYRYFNDNMLSDARKRQHIIDNIDRAISEGWIKVYYQPIVRTSSGWVCDEEALARWIDPERGMLSPADFIPALEEARLIYKLDLHVVEQALEKMRVQAAAGLYVVPVSVNLSRADFEACDIVEEIRARVDAAGAPRDKLTIEITESIVGSDFDYIRAQVARFRDLGFSVWMDDFGSGYSSLDVLQNIHFDVIKFDMRFMQHFDSGVEGRIILTELVKMAINLDVETVCEGVETAEQVEFLRDIGCTKIQGFFYGRPIPQEEIFARYRNGTQIGLENPAESEYYERIGRANLYDMDVLTQEDETLRRYFDAVPTAIVEIMGDKTKFTRCNGAFRAFVRRMFGIEQISETLSFDACVERFGATITDAVKRCSEDGNRALTDEKMDEKTTVHSLIRRVAINPVTGTTAIAIAVLAIIEEKAGEGTTYEHIARALTADYINLYYVDLNTEKFIEYSSDVTRENLVMERHGDDFFGASQKDARLFLHKDDLERFTRVFTKENVVRTMDQNGNFMLVYRLMIKGEPTFVSMKAMRMNMDRSHMIIGVSNVDAQMRQKEALARIQAEQITYSRITALSGDYICIYTVDPDTDRYTEYSATSAYEGLGFAKQGEDFFDVARRDGERAIYADDLPRFKAMFSRENIMREIEHNGLFELKYRLVIDGEPRYVSVKAAMVQEQDGPQLIIGVNNIDAQVKREQELERRLYAARSRANLDTLTGVKNRTAYESMSDRLARQIEEGVPVKYAIALCRVAGLQRANETQGRQAGDQLIRQACTIVCNIFKHSPVFRVTGDEFAVIAQGHDYEEIDQLVAEVEASNANKALGEGASIVCGMAKYTGSDSVTSVFARADALCHRADAQ